MSTKLHAACTDERTGVSFTLSGGECHDATGFEPVWEGMPEWFEVMAAVMDKPYDNNAIRRFLAVLGIEAVIPPERIVPSRFITMPSSRHARTITLGVQ